MLGPILLSLTLVGQGPAPQGAYEAELKRLAAEDQADRQFQKPPSKSEWKPIAKRDEKRRRRVYAILKDAKELNAEEFDAASLLMQHGSKPEDFVLAHELSACANALGKISSMPALSEDRFLTYIHRKQRFGSQFLPDGKTQNPVDGASPTDVTDELRMTLLVPPLAAYREFGPMAFMKVQDTLFDHLVKRRDPQHPLAGSSDLSAKLVVMRPSVGTRFVVLDLYQHNQIVTREDYANAAQLLLGSTNSDELLLSHEFSTVAMSEGYLPARRLFAQTWDAFAASIGWPRRYERGQECRAVKKVLFG